MKIGNEIGGTPALLLPDGKGRRRGGENPAGGAWGGWKCEGGQDIFLLRSQEGIEHIQFYFILIWLPRRFVQ